MMLIYIDKLLFKTIVLILSDFFYAQPQNLKFILFNGLFVFLVSLFIWKGSEQVIKKIRTNNVVKSNIYKRLVALIVMNGVISITVVAIALQTWQNIFKTLLTLNQLYVWYAIAFIAAAFITVLYECFYLNRELDLDKKVFKQLENERIDTEMNVLKNELNPHFIFNSLTALSHLIDNDQPKAQLFTHKLSQVYKYFLINKDREVISLEEELKFLNDYFYLLKIRYDNMVRLKLNIGHDYNNVMILPCALQVLVENAIKHNMFTEEAPLEINVSLNKNYLVVTNNLKCKLYTVDSTKIGLRNLNTRYRLLTHSSIISYSSKGSFVVKIPLIKQTVAKLI